jgi:hypothetical protein
MRPVPADPQLQDRVSDAVLTTLGDFGAVHGLLGISRSVFRVAGLRITVEPDGPSGDLTPEDVAALIQVCDTFRDLARSVQHMPGAMPWTIRNDALVRGVREKLRARL